MHVEAFLVARQIAPAAKASTSLQMVIRHMKPYTTIEQVSDGVRYLPLQLQCAELDGLAALLRGHRLLACRIPEMQTARSAWQVILDFDPDMSLELTSSSTVAQGWDEFGTINVEVLSRGAVESTSEWGNLICRKTLTLSASRSCVGKATD
jgi:hypothetical protein